jgi:acyl-CoA synthetase (AMP-forming)/AMP-acid ligase II
VSGRPDLTEGWVEDAAGLWDLIERRARATPDALFAVDDMDRRMSFAEYRGACEGFAGMLAERGVGEGTRVSWQLPTWLESMVLAGALCRLGAVQNPILPIYRRREVEFVTRQCQAKLLVVPRVFRGFDHAAMASDLPPETLVLDPEPGTVLEKFRNSGSDHPADAPLPSPPPPTSPDDAPVRWIFYTSGTTADPKGALHTDHTLLATFTAMGKRLLILDDDRVALVFPFTHIGGIGWLLIGLAAGCAHIVVPVFDPKTSIPLLARHGVTQATAGTAFHQAYLAAQRAQPDRPLFPRVRAFPGGGAPKPPGLHHDIKREMGGAGIVAGYGLTECPVLAMSSPRDPDDKLANTEGFANPPGLEIRVIKPDGTPAAPGEEGEIRARGPQLCKGYLDASLNADAFDADGFFRTGDLGAVDADGYVVITGRLKDVIVRKGENISAREVEDLLHQHPKVLEAAVVGLPDAESGERACAVIVCRDADDPLGFAEMQGFLASRDLMRQKIPEQLELLAELPRNPTGKVLKHELRERFGGDGGDGP